MKHVQTVLNEKIEHGFVVQIVKENDPMAPAELTRKVAEEADTTEGIARQAIVMALNFKQIELDRKENVYVLTDRVTDETPLTDEPDEPADEDKPTPDNMDKLRERAEEQHDRELGEGEFVEDPDADTNDSTTVIEDDTKNVTEVEHPTE